MGVEGAERFDGRLGGVDGVGSSLPGAVNERRAHRLRAVDGVRVARGVPEVRAEIPPPTPQTALLMLGPVPLHGLRPAHLPREPARHRSVPRRRARAALPHGLPRAGHAQHAGRRQRAARLAHLRRLRPDPDRRGAPPLRGRALGGGPGGDGLRLRLDDDRPLSLALPLGPLPPHQGRHQAAHAAGPARQHPDVHPRSPPARCTTSCSWTRSSPSPALSTCSTAATWTSLASTSARGAGRLCDPRQQEPALPPALLPPGGSLHGDGLRPDHRPAHPRSRSTPTPRPCGA